MNTLGYAYCVTRLEYCRKKEIECRYTDHFKQRSQERRILSEDAAHLFYYGKVLDVSEDYDKFTHRETIKFELLSNYQGKTLHGFVSLANDEFSHVTAWFE